jgi:RNA-directed DNA polymerase
MVRHVKVPGQARPYDGTWSYGAARRGQYPGVSWRLAALLKTQAGHCEACGLFCTPEDLIELQHRDGNRSDHRSSNLAVVHRHGQDQIHGGRHDLSQQFGTHDKRPFN